jgi:hypothetical protein
MGYSTALVNDGSLSADDFTSEFNSRNEIALPENAIWYSLITMTTIGYGDMAVSVSLSRIIVVILSIASAVFFPLFIVTVEGFLLFGYQEKMSYQIFKLMGVKEQMKEAACLLMQKNLKRVNLLNKLFRSSPDSTKKVNKDKTSIDELEGSKTDLLNKNNRVTKANYSNSALDPEEEKEIAFELQAVNADIFELSRDFKLLRMEYRNSLFTDFHTDTNLDLMMLNEFMEGLIFFLEFHMENRKKNPHRYPSEEDFKNYHKIMTMAFKPKAMETRYYLKDLVDNEYIQYWHEGTKHEIEEKKYLRG